MSTANDLADLISACQQLCGHLQISSKVTEKVEDYTRQESQYAAALADYLRQQFGQGLMESVAKTLINSVDSDLPRIQTADESILKQVAIARANLAASQAKLTVLVNYPEGDDRIDRQTMQRQIAERQATLNDLKQQAVELE